MSEGRNAQQETHRRRGLIAIAEAAVAPRLAMERAVPQPASPGRGHTDAVEGMLFVPVRPAVRGSAERRILHGAA
jgi:hypothetical protein